MMHTVDPVLDDEFTECGERAEAIYQAEQNDVHKRTDRMFANLLIMQWVGGILAALWISPRTWAGSASETHIHVWTAIFLGAAISSFPIFLAWKRPGHWFTRQTIAVAQTLTSALLIHLTGGRIETHFHVFGSLAFLAFYRDWRVLATATVVVAADHLVRGVFWPQSVFGVLSASNWRWLEHAAWVLFEDTFLLISIRHSLNDLYDAAVRRAKLESLHAETERRVKERTSELLAAHRQLLESSRRAGMAEVATNVLHNVGNVLNSVNVSAETLAGKVRQFKAGNFKKAAGLLRENAGNLPDFLCNDPRGRELPGYMVTLAENLAEPQTAILEEIDSLRKNIQHIKEIVTMQQGFARSSSMLESVSPIELMEHAIRINTAGLARHDVHVIRQYDDVPEIETDRHQVLQILVNLLSNAKHALKDAPGEKQVLLSITANGNGDVKFCVADNGCGIAPENLHRIFEHGFTTKAEGHGFGLHSGALAARELGGELVAHSDGIGKGALFTLGLPTQPVTHKR
ncbi:MAG TPA: ATP-binding protein [Candidatus Saccharimonadia bacterium]|nr:ATP-binding protein [Candidatus Saccharimonadia bacterium]